MTEYIDRANLIARIKYYVTHTPKDKGEHYAYSVMLNEILNRPAADVVSVVRCKDCKYRTVERSGLVRCRAFNYMPMCVDNFCSYGERKEEGADDV